MAAAIGCLATIFGSRGWGQSLEPRSYSNTPVGLNFLLVGYDYGEGEVSFDPAVPLTDAHINLNTEVVAFNRSFDAWGDSAKYTIVLPVVDLDGSALFAGEPKSRQVTGIADPQFKVAVNLYGSPALSLPEFRNYHQDLIVGTSLQITAPLGQYNSSKLINIGSDRWSFKPELGLSKAVGPWTFDWYNSATFYTEKQQFHERRHDHARSAGVDSDACDARIFSWDMGSSRCHLLLGRAHHRQRPAHRNPAGEFALRNDARCAYKPFDVDKAVCRHGHVGPNQQQFQ